MFSGGEVISPWSVALLLIMLPPCDDAGTPSTDTTVHFQALKDTAQLLELWPAVGNWGQYHTEVGWCQRHFRLCYGSPSLGDIHRLPPTPLIEARLEFNEQHESYLLDLRLARMYDGLAIDNRLAENRRLWHIWSLMRRARTENEPHAWAARRIALLELREMIGEDAYYSGRWGPWVP